MEFIESLERLALADKFRKYQPTVPRKGHGKEWLMLCHYRCTVVKCQAVIGRRYADISGNNSGNACFVHTKTIQ